MTSNDQQLFQLITRKYSLSFAPDGFFDGDVIVDHGESKSADSNQPRKFFEETI